jgi:hypothetical protein
VYDVKRVKVAVTDWNEEAVLTVHANVPGQEPPTTLQPVNTDPAFGAAVKVTITPSN